LFKIRLKYAIPEIDGTLYEVGTRVSHANEEEEIPEKENRSLSSCGEATEAQKNWRQSFSLAVAYMRAVKADPEIRARYEVMAQQQGKTLRKMVLNDFMEGHNLFYKQ
jgi:hypothetical protein